MAMAEFLRFDVDGDFDCIIFRSVQSESRTNYVVCSERNDTEDACSAHAKKPAKNAGFFRASIDQNLWRIPTVTVACLLEPESPVAEPMTATAAVPDESCVPDAVV